MLGTIGSPTEGTAPDGSNNPPVGSGTVGPLTDTDGAFVSVGAVNSVVGATVVGC